MKEQDHIEIKIIGTIISTASFDHGVYAILTEDHFINQSLREIFASSKIISSESREVNLISVVDDLRKRKRLDYVGGVRFISELTSESVSYDMFSDLALLLSEYLYRRRLKNLSVHIQEMANDMSFDVFEAISKATQLIEEINDSTDIRKETDKREVVLELLNDIPKRKDRGFQGVPCHIKTIDEKLSGFDKVGTTVIAGRPGQGKTRLAISMALKMVNHGMKGAFFTLEMSASSIYSIMLSIDASVSTWKINKGILQENEMTQLEASGERIIDLPIQVFDKLFKVSEIVSKCRQMKNKGLIDFVFIDYLQLMELGGQKNGNREQEVSAISRALKKMAMQLEVPVFELSQLSRKVEERSDKRPILADLRESGSIEQDASTVLFCFRPSYYGITGDAGESLEDHAYLICGKHRNGGLSDIKLHYRHDHNQEWCDPDESSSFVIDNYGNNLPRNTSF